MNKYGKYTVLRLFDGHKKLLWLPKGKVRGGDKLGV